MKKKWPTLSCPSSEGFNFWEHEWEKHGTCSESEMDQHDYFENALKLRDRANILQILTNSGTTLISHYINVVNSCIINSKQWHILIKIVGIKPDDGFYDLKKISNAIKDAIGFTPGIECNKDPELNSQLYQIYICVDTSGTVFIECPVLPRGRCPSKLQFSKFWLYFSFSIYFTVMADVALLCFLIVLLFQIQISWEDLKCNIFYVTLSTFNKIKTLE